MECTIHSTATEKGRTSGIINQPFQKNQTFFFHWGGGHIILESASHFSFPHPHQSSFSVMISFFPEYHQKQNPPRIRSNSQPWRHLPNGWMGLVYSFFQLTQITGFERQAGHLWTTDVNTSLWSSGFTAVQGGQKLAAIGFQKVKPCRTL